MASQPSAKLIVKPERPTHLPLGRWLGDFGSLSAFEARLVKDCAIGAVCSPASWDEKRPAPDGATKANTIRAELIRFLALGGDDAHPLHEKGVMLRGAYIKDELELRLVSLPVRLDLQHCYLDHKPDLIDSKFPELCLAGCKLPGLSADGIVVSGDVFLDDGFEASGEVSLIGAQISGTLSCTGGKFSNEGGYALKGDRLRVAGSVFLSEQFEAFGEVRLHSASIGGNLTCINGKFDNSGGVSLYADTVTVRGEVYLSDGFVSHGEIRLLGAKIGGDLCCVDGKFHNEGGIALNTDSAEVVGSILLRHGFEAIGKVCLLGAQVGSTLSCIEGRITNAGDEALSADGITVKSYVFLREASIDGSINLMAAKVGSLADDADFWKSGGHLLDGLRYDRIIGPTNSAMRIAWLQSQQFDEVGTDFKPQPWEQLMKVMREMGHPTEASEIAIAKQRALRKAKKIKGVAGRFMHLIYGGLAGYGYRPLRVVFLMALLCVLCAVAFYGGREYGMFGPTHPAIHNSAAFTDCGTTGNLGAKHWTSANCGLPPEYPTLQPFLYSLDVILPVVDLQQEAHWGPVVTSSKGEVLWEGRILRWLLWIEILFGWIGSLVLVAILGRLVK